MFLPTKIPGLKLATILLGVYVAVWIPLEGNLAHTILMGVWVTLVAAGRLTQRFLGGRMVSPGWWWLLAAGLGLLVGLSSNGLTLVFMVMKTGLHAHGPEFTRAEINWVLEQMPLWGAAGLFGGLGLGLLALAARR